DQRSRKGCRDASQPNVLVVRERLVPDPWQGPVEIEEDRDERCGVLGKERGKGVVREGTPPWFFGGQRHPRGHPDGRLRGREKGGARPEGPGWASSPTSRSKSAGGHRTDRATALRGARGTRDQGALRSSLSGRSRLARTRSMNGRNVSCSSAGQPATARSIAG